MKKLLTALCLVALAASGASADILWDQSNFSTVDDGFLNMASNACSQISGNTKVHIANDVTFASDVIITSVTIYERAYGNADASTLAYLWIAPKTGSLPTEASTLVNVATNSKPTTGAYVTIGGVTARAITVTLSPGLALPAGSYWVSLTPRHNLGLVPYSVLKFSADGVIGDPSCAIQACTANSTWYYPYAPDTNYDCAFKVEGTAVVATENQAWGNIKALYR